MSIKNPENNQVSFKASYHFAVTCMYAICICLPLNDCSEWPLFPGKPCAAKTVNNIVGGVIAAGVFEETKTVSCNLGYVVVGALSDTTYTTVCQSSGSWQTATECTSKYDF